jgi:hypothetical protein
MKRIDMNQFNEKQIKAIQILAMPNRGGMEFDEIADKVGISVRQLHRWRNIPEFKAAIVETSLDLVKDELPAVLLAHRKQAEKGNVKAIELFYKLFGLLIERQEIETVTASKDKSNEDIDSDIAELKALIEDVKGD